MVFVVERQTTKFFIHETVPHSTRVWFSILRPRKFFHKLPQNSLLTKILPPEKYPLYGIEPDYICTCTCMYVCTYIISMYVQLTARNLEMVESRIVLGQH